MSQIFTTEAQVQSIINSIISGQRNAAGGLVGLLPNGQIDPKYLADSLGTGNGGAIATSDSPPVDSVNRVYYPSTSGTYTNFSGLVVDISDGLNIIIGNDTDGFEKVVVPIDLAGYATTTQIEGLILSVPGKNLFNKDKTTDGFFVSWVNGNLSASGLYSASEFIKIKPNTNYCISGTPNKFLAFYNSSKLFISGIQTPINPFLTPSTAFYIRITCNIESKDSTQLEEGSAVTGYIPYSTEISDQNLKLKKEQLPDETLTSDDPITAQMVNFLDPTKNLFDITKVTANKFINWLNGSLGDNTSYMASDFIPVTEGLSYFLSGEIALHHAFYNDSKTFISGANTTVWPIVAPIGAAFIRFSVRTVNSGTIMFEQNNEQTSYEKFGFKFNELIYQDTVTEVDEVKVSFLGDSLTAQYEWGEFLNEKKSKSIGLIVNLLGVGGSRVSGSASNAFWQDARINTIALDSKVVFVFGGTNDWANNAPMGTLNSTNTNDFMGAINVIIEKVINLNPEIILIFVTPPYSEFINFASRGWDNPVTNTLGYSINDYSEAIRLVCFNKNITFADVNAKCGWNTLNVDYFMKDDGAHIHPNDLGGKRIGYIMADELNKFFK